MSKIIVRKYGKFEQWTITKYSSKPKKRKEREQWKHYSEKLENNIARAKSNVRELALCNDWEWFATLTIDPQKYDRTDLETFYKDFHDFVRCMEHPPKYVIVPELHADGKSYHLHALISGLPVKAFAFYNGHWNWKRYFARFGFSDFQPVHGDNLGVALYMTKYITKDAGKAVPVGKQIYRASKGLKRAETLASENETSEVYDQLVDEFNRLEVERFENDYIIRKTTR